MVEGLLGAELAGDFSYQVIEWWADQKLAQRFERRGGCQVAIGM